MKEDDNELLAVKILIQSKYLIVVYRELNSDDGFVITSFLTSKINYLKSRKLIWEKTK